MFQFVQVSELCTLKVHSELKFILLGTVSTLVYSLSHKARN